MSRPRPWSGPASSGSSPGQAAHRQWRRDPVYLASSRGSLRDLPGRRRHPGRELVLTGATAGCPRTSWSPRCRLEFGRDPGRPGAGGRTPSGHRLAPAQEPCTGHRSCVVRLTRRPVTDVSLEVRPGERVGSPACSARGSPTLARIVAGAAPTIPAACWSQAPELTAGRRDLNLKAGVGYIPEDRQGRGIRRGAQRGRERDHDHQRLARRVGRIPAPVDSGRGRRAARPAAVHRLGGVSARSPANCSVGNPQKVTVARALAREPRLIVAITPTRGVDVASKSLLLAELARGDRETGTACCWPAMNSMTWSSVTG